jgi:predicted ATPase/DNA-binding SARP family transcriptional activator
VGVTLEIRVLGPIEATRSGDPVALGGPRQRALLALLARRRGGTVPADELIEDLWAGEPTDGAATSLRSYVSRLRRSLHDDGLVVARDGGYAIDPSVVIDAERFEQLIHEGEAALAGDRSRLARARLREALALWRGMPFGEQSTVPSLDAEATRLGELQLHAIELRVQADLDLGESASLVDELERLVLANPYRERLWGQLMVALYRDGRQADALSAYGRARRLLDEELGIDPGAELQALEGAILRQEIENVLPPPERHNLPNDVSSFVGREREIAEILGFVAEQRLVTLTGVGGTGKTRLAIAVARSFVGELSDGVTFVDLGPVKGPEDVAGHLARELEITQSTDTSPTAAIVDRLGTEDRLLLIDNCEHVAGGVATVVAAILSGCPFVRILATSREVLGVLGEATYPVQPLATADVDGEAVRLFLARAREVRPGLLPDQAALAQVAHICRVLDGLPLAIELAAARTKVLTLTEIGNRLDDRFRFLVSWRRLATARHRTLRAAMDWSYELLGTDEQAFLRRASIFLGGFTLEAAAAVCTGGEADEALRLIERLAEASLLGSAEMGPAMRYRMLETVREYAVERSDQAEIEDAASRHLRYFLELAEHGRQGVETDGRIPLLRDLIVEDANLRGALQRAASAEGSLQVELRFCAALWSYWWLHGQLAEGWSSMEHALERASSPGAASFPTELAETLCGASSLALRRGDVENAVALAQRAQHVAMGIAPSALARAQVALANALASANDIDRPGPLYEAAAHTFRELGMTWRLANVLLNAADFAFARGDLDLVDRTATESLAMVRALGDDAGIAVNLGNLAFADLARGAVDRADARLREALERSHALGFGEWVAIMLDGLGAVAAARGQDQRGAVLIGAAAQIRDEIGASLDSIERSVHARTVAALEERMGRRALDAGMGQGRALPTTRAVALALEGPG